MAETFDTRLVPFGWAPGGYGFKCEDCPADLPFTEWAMGAKHSWRCEKHAREAYERALKEPPPPPPLSSLEDFCRAFIAEQRISCAETVSQCDRVIVNAYEFIEGICERVGYHQEQE